MEVLHAYTQFGLYGTAYILGTISNFGTMSDCVGVRLCVGRKFHSVPHNSFSVYFFLFAVGKDGGGYGDGGGPVPRVGHVLRRRRPRVGEGLILRYTQV